MEEEAKNVISIAYDQIAGLGALQTLGGSILGAALGIYMVIELYRLVTTGRCDMVTPIIKIAGAILILYSLVPIGNFISDAMQSTSEKLLNTNVFVLASDAWTAAFEGVSGPIDFVSNLFSQITWLSLLTWLCLVIVIILKIVVIDVLFPILLGVVVITGALSIPIGVFPGANSMKGWVMNLVEISIWPLVFQILATMLFATFATQLQAVDSESMAALRQMYNDVQPDNMMEKVELMADKEKQAQVKAIESGVFKKFVKFLAIAAAYGLLCLFTPLLCRMIVRSESAGFVGGIVTAASTRMIARATSRVSNRFGRAAGYMGRYAYNSPIVQGMKNIAVGAKEKASAMDRRESVKA